MPPSPHGLAKVLHQLLLFAHLGILAFGPFRDALLGVLRQGDVARLGLLSGGELELRTPPIGVDAGVCGRAASPLLFGERGDELAAEGRDVRDHAAPHRVMKLCKCPVPRPGRPLGAARNRPCPRLVYSWVWREAREEAEVG